MIDKTKQALSLSDQQDKTSFISMWSTKQNKLYLYVINKTKQALSLCDKQNKPSFISMW